MQNKVFCIVSARYLPYLGGVERYVYNISKELMKQGNRIIILTSCMKGDTSYEIDNGIEVYRLPSVGLLDKRFPILLYNKKTRDIVKKLNNEQIDYMVVNTRFYILSLFAVFYAAKRKIPSIVIEHGTGHFTVNNVFFDFVGHIYEHIITELIKKKCRDFYGVSLACNEWLAHYKINAKGVLYNAINLEEIEKIYNATELGKKICSKIEYNEKDFIITYTGRLVKEKGIEKLIVAFEEIKQEYSNVKLCIAGDGPLYEILSKKRRKGVYFLGRLEFSDVIQLLKHSNVYILPTDYPEGLPTSVLEAMACKNYVITTKAGGSKEVIIDSNYGEIMEYNSVKELKKAIIDVVNNEIQRKKVAENAFQRVKENYVWEKTCEQLIKIFDGDESIWKK